MSDSLPLSGAIVADDHELFRSALAEILRREFHFHRIIEAASLDAAVEHLGQAPDVTFACIDLAMPGMNGTAGLLAIREVYPNVRVAVITGSERREDILGALGAGVHGYIPKTLRIVEIAAAIRTVLEGGIFVPAALAKKSPGASPQRVMPPPVQESKSKSYVLSPRQTEVLTLMAEGKSNKQIARDLGLAEGTVKVHVAALFRTLGTNNRVSAVSALMQIKGSLRPN